MNRIKYNKRMKYQTFFSIRSNWIIFIEYNKNLFWKCQAKIQFYFFLIYKTPIYNNTLKKYISYSGSLKISS